MALSKSLICATVPVIVTDDVPELVTTAPLVPAVIVSVPSVTASVTVIEPAPASASAIDNPVFFRLRLTCSVAE